MGQVIDFFQAKERLQTRNRKQAERAASGGLAQGPGQDDNLWELMLLGEDEQDFEDRVELEIPQELLAEIVFQEGRRAQQTGKHAQAIKSFYWVVSNSTNESVRALARLAAANSDFILAKMTNFKTTLERVRGGLPLLEENVSCVFFLLEGNYAWDLSDRKRAFCHFQKALKTSNKAVNTSGVRQMLLEFLDNHPKLSRHQVRQALYQLADNLIREAELDLLATRLGP